MRLRPLPLALVAALTGFGLGRIYVSAPERPAPSRIADLQQIALSAPVATPAPPQVPAIPLPATPQGITPTPATEQKSLSERLSSAYREDDPFSSAARIQELIGTFTAEDFHWLATEATNLPVAQFHGFDSQFSDAVMDALVERWLQVDPAGALSGIREADVRLKKNNNVGQDQLPKALARVRPEVLLESLPEDASWSQFDNSIPLAFQNLGKRDPAAARSFLNRCRLPEQRKRAEVEIALGVAGKNPVTAVKLALDLQSPEVFQTAILNADRIGSGMVAQVLEASGGKLQLPAMGTAEIILRNPDLPWASIPVEAVTTKHGLELSLIDNAMTLTREDRDRVLAHASQLPPGVGDKAITAVIYAWAEKEPQAAVEWALTYATPTEDDSTRNAPISSAFFAFLRSDATAALEWLSDLPPSPLKAKLGTNAAIGALVEKGKLDQALQLFQPPPGPAGADAIESMARAQAERDPVAAAAWLTSLPQESETAGAVTELMTRWVRKDAEAAAKWVESQPAGIRRDQAISAYTQAAAARDPRVAAEWAATVSDPALRQKAAEVVFNALERRDPDNARSWLRSLPGIDATWRERLLRLHR